MTRREARAFAELGRRDGEAAGRRAIAALPRSDARGRLGRAVEQQFAQLGQIAADALERGAPADAIEEYRVGWREGFESRLDELTARLLPLLPADDEGEEL